MPGELTVGRELLSSLVIVAQLGSSGYAATVAARRLVRDDQLVRALTWVLLVLAQATGVSLVLAMVGLFKSPAVLVAHVAIAAGARRWQQRVPVARRSRDDRSGATPLDAIAAAATTLYLVLNARLSLRPERSLDFDTKEYHLANLASWVQTGNLWRLPYSQPGSMTSTHPSSGDLFGAWLALPTHGDELVYLAPLGFGLLAVLAGAVLGRELSSDRNGAALGALASVAVLSAPVYFGQVDSMLTDVISASAIVAGVAFIVVALRSDPSRRALVALAGTAIGLGVGSKYTALLPGLVIGVGAVWLFRRAGAWRWLLPGPVLFAAPWFVRNLVTTGNPIFPQPVGPFEGAATYLDVLDASMLHHIIHTESDILRSTAELARDHVGPVLGLIAAGLVLCAALAHRSRDPRLLVGIGALTAIALVLYLATPYTGGGPTGLAFIIVSCFRYAMIPAFLGAVAGAVLAGRWIGALAVVATIGWNLWRNVDRPAAGRPELALSWRDLAIALAITAAVAGVALLVRHESSRLRGMPPPASIALAVAVATGCVAAVAGVLHHVDRGRTPTPLERTLLAFGEHEPAVAIGTNDLRAVLGPRLERRLVKVSRGGAAQEIPFADEAQLRRKVLGEDTPPPPPELGPALDQAIEASGARILVIGPSPLGYPDGWRPRDDWCLVGATGEGVVLVRAELLPVTTPCTPASG